MSLSHSPSIIMTNLVSYYDAGNTKSYPGSGTVWTDMGGTINGTINGGAAFGGSPKTFTFDGVNDYVSMGTAHQYQDTFSIEAVFKFPALPTVFPGGCGPRHPIVTNHDYGYNLEVDSTGSLNWNLYNTVSTAQTASSPIGNIGSYVHCVGYKSGTTIALYVNGVHKDAKVLTSNALHYIAEPFTIGGFRVCGAGRHYATGDIPLVKVYTKVLTPTEILQNFNAVRGRFGI